MNPDGTDQVNVSNTVTLNEDTPSWSPDGTRIIFSSNREGTDDLFSMTSFGSGVVNLTNLSGVDQYPSWSGYLPRTPKKLVGSGGALGASAAGFLFGLKGKQVTSVVAFDTTTAGSRAASRVVSQTASETQATNVVFGITTSAGGWRA